MCSILHDMIIILISNILPIMQLSTLQQTTGFVLSAPHDCPKWQLWYLSNWDKITSVITTKFKKLKDELENIVLEIIDDHANVKSIVWLV